MVVSLRHTAAQFMVKSLLWRFDHARLNLHNVVSYILKCATVLSPHNFAANNIRSQIFLIVCNAVSRIEVSYFLLEIELALLFLHFSGDFHSDFLLNVSCFAAHLCEIISFVPAGTVFLIECCHNFGPALTTDTVRSDVKDFRFNRVLEIQVLLRNVFPDLSPKKTV